MQKNMGYVEVIDGCMSDRKRLKRRTVLKGIGAATLGFGVGSAKARKKGKGRPDKVPVPSGEWVDPSRIVSHENEGKALRAKEFRKKHPFPTNRGNNSRSRKNYPDTDDWLRWGWAVNDSYSQFVAPDWIVPKKPPSYERPNKPNIFYFPALQEYGSGLVQPVLQWNWYNRYNDEGYPGEWAMSAWWGPDSNGDYHHGEIKKVSPGHSLYGFMGQKSNGRWYIDIINESTNEVSDITSSESIGCDEAYVALEGGNYEYGNCDWLPGDCMWENMTIRDGNGDKISESWYKGDDNNTTCSLGVNIYSSQKIEITTPN
ncbi:MAG: hypothetical protein SXQ77_07470 [Halobacteria archaeon]|nr:hypothetical protein [Halobacteria archaeon]